MGYKARKLDIVTSGRACPSRALVSSSGCSNIAIEGMKHPTLSSKVFTNRDLLHQHQKAPQQLINIKSYDSDSSEDTFDSNDDPRAANYSTGIRTMWPSIVLLNQCAEALRRAAALFDRYRHPVTKLLGIVSHVSALQRVRSQCGNSSSW